MTFAKLFFSASVFVVGGCMGVPSSPGARGFDLTLSHPAPFATYIQVSPGASGAALPSAREIASPQFSLYLHRVTGCARDTQRPAEPMGGRAAPAGYMVPVVCP
ncbi:MAG: hypothetical protein AB8B82_03160 [Roseovarius sp.]